MSKKDKQNTNNAPSAEAELLPSAELKGFQKLKKTLDDNGYIGCAFIISFAIMWMIYIALRVFPFGPNSVLVLDLNGQYVYFFEALRNAIYGEGSLLYSWSRTLGGEFMGIYAYYIASPLSYIVALFPKENITEALLVMFLIKTGLCGATMSWYLRKTRPASNEMISIAVSCMYALSSYAVVQAHNTMWIDALIWFPLVIYGTEQLIKKHKFALFCVSLTMTLLSTFYIGYMVCIFVFFYFFYYYFFGSAGDNNFYREKLHFIKSLARMAGAAVTSLLASCIILLPTYYSLSFGKTTFSTVEWAKEMVATRFNIIQFASKLFIGGYDTVRPEGLPFLYCGMLALILVPLYFVTKKISLKEKIGAGLIILFLYFSMNISAIDIVWHAFQKPNWLNYRYSFMLIFIMLVIAHRVLEEIDDIKPVYIYSSAGVFTALLLAVLIADYDYINPFYCILLSAGLIALYTAALIIFKKKITLRPALSTVLAVIICTEMFIGGVINTNSLDADVTFSPRNTSSQSYLEGYSEFMQRMRGIVNKVQDRDKTFYRMENTDIRKVCDNHALNVKGLSASTSTLNKDTIKLLQRFGYLSQSHWSEYGGETELSDSLFGVKYVIHTSEQDSELSELFDTYTYTVNGEEKTMYAYLNKYALPLAYASSADVKDFNITSFTSPFELMNSLVTALLGESETLEIFKEIPYEHQYSSELMNFKPTTYTEVMYDKYGNPIINDKGETAKEDVFYYTFSKKPAQEGESAEGKGDPTIDFIFDLSGIAAESPDVYVYIPTSYSRACDWKCGELSGTFFDSGTSCIQRLEGLSKDEKQTFTVTVKSDEFYVDRAAGMFFYLDTELYRSCMERLAEGGYSMTSFTDSHLNGTVKTDSDGEVLFTTIPYDEGWQIYVDGKKADLIKTCAALIAVDLGSAGEHTVELRYMPRALTLGSTLTVVGVVVFVCALAADRFYFRKKREAMLEK